MHRFIAASAVLLVAASAAANEGSLQQPSGRPAVETSSTPSADVAPQRFAQRAKEGATAAPKSGAAAPPTATAELKAADGKDVGTVKLTQTRAGVRLDLALKGLPPGAQHILKVVKDVAPGGQVAVKRADIYNGRPVPFVPFTKLDGEVIKGTH